MSDDYSRNGYYGLRMRIKRIPNRLSWQFNRIVQPRSFCTQVDGITMTRLALKKTTRSYLHPSKFFYTVWLPIRVYMSALSAERCSRLCSRAGDDGQTGVLMRQDPSVVHRSVDITMPYYFFASHSTLHKHILYVRVLFWAGGGCWWLKASAWRVCNPRLIGWNGWLMMNE